jgi:hypothetical protein
MEDAFATAASSKAGAQDANSTFTLSMDCDWEDIPIVAAANTVLTRLIQIISADSAEDNESAGFGQTFNICTAYFFSH